MREWEETVTGELARCTYCPFKACKDCPEAEPVDPVEAKARELWEVVKPSVYATWSGTNEKAKDQFRKVAAHVLGQEAER